MFDKITFLSFLVAPILIFDEDGVLTSTIFALDDEFEIDRSIQFDSFSVAGFNLSIFEDDIFLFGKNRYKTNELQHFVLDQDFDVLAQTIYHAEGEYAFPGFSVMIDSSFYTSYFVELEDGTVRQEGITKFNQYSDVDWQKKYNSNIELSYPWKMVSSIDSSLIVSSGIHFFNELGRYTQLKKIDSNGNVIWTTNGNERLTHGAVPVWVTELSDGSILQSFEVDKQGEPGYIFGDWNTEPIRLVWYDGEGIVINDKTINYPKADEMHYSNIESGLGDYFYTYGNYSKDIVDADDFYFGILSKYNNDGSLIWTHKYQNPDYEGSHTLHNITDIIEMENGDIVTLGTVQRLGFSGKLWMMRLNSFGCLNNVDCNEIVITDLENIEDEKIEISPNPTTGIVNIKGTDIDAKSFRLLDAHGRYIDELSIYSEMLDLNHLPNGIYFLHFPQLMGKGGFHKIVLIR